MLIRWTMGEVIMDTQGEDNNLTAVFKAETRTNTFIPFERSDKGDALYGAHWLFSFLPFFVPS